MSIENLPEVQNGTLTVSQHGEILARYKHLRAVGVELCNNLVRQLPKTSLDEGARRLGILQRGVFVFDSIEESAVLMDYCLHDVRIKGRNTIEQYLIESPPDADSDEMVCLRALQHAIYTAFVVESVENGFGLMARDIFTDATHLIVDIGLSSSVKPGDMFASRLIQHEGFSMTGGAPLPIGWVSPALQPEVINQFCQTLAMVEGGLSDPAALILACRKNGASSSVRYEDPNESLGAPRLMPITNDSPKTGRNAPCFCGSGKKYKHCCLRR